MKTQHHPGGDMRITLSPGNLERLECEGFFCHERHIGDDRLVTTILRQKGTTHAAVDIVGTNVTVTLPEATGFPVVAIVSPGEGYQADANRYLMGDHGRVILDVEIDRCPAPTQ